MKKLYIIIIFLSTLCACNMNEQEQAKFDFRLPSADSLWQSMTITVDSIRHHVYAYTDRVGGFWQGTTFETNNGGYATDNGQRLLADWLWADGVQNVSRKKSIRASITPAYITHEFANGYSEKIGVLMGQKGLVISLMSDKKTTFVPIWAADSSEYDFSLLNNMLVAIHKSTKQFVLIAGENVEVVKRNDATTRQHEWGLESKEEKGAKNFVVLIGADIAILEEQMRKIIPNPLKEIEKRQQDVVEYLTHNYVKTNLPDYDKALNWCKISGRDLIVRQNTLGIWAGLPWFNQNWGRDTYISLPGISLVTGDFDNAQSIINDFTQYQITDTADIRYGRIPNRVNSPTDIIYNTADGTPWLVREMIEYLKYTGNTDKAMEWYSVVKYATDGALKNTDADGFLIHDDADTWMDARIEGNEAWSPRGNRAVEIQALWINQLESSAFLAQLADNEMEARLWNDLAERVRENFNRLYVNIADNTIYDHLNNDKTADLQIRPNQIMALTVPLFEPLVANDVQSAVLQQVVSKLMYKHGIASLYQNDDYFHPYHHDQIYHFDAAYHNGLCWQWNSGQVVTAMVEAGYTDLAFEHSRELARQTLEVGMLGSLSELVLPLPEKNGDIKWSGTYSQAWSVSEFVRNFYQDYAGIRPNMMQREIIVRPAMPKVFTDMQFTVNVGKDEKIDCIYSQVQGSYNYTFRGTALKDTVKIRFQVTDSTGAWHETVFSLWNAQVFNVHQSDRTKADLSHDQQAMALTPTGKKMPAMNKDLTFAIPALRPDLKCLTEKDYLQKIRIKEFKNKTSPIVGRWGYGSDPLEYLFKEDNSYEEYLLDAPSLAKSGTWKLKGNKLTLTPKGGAAKTMTITFKDNMFYLGDFEKDYTSRSQTYSSMTKDRYFREFGYMKQ